MLVVRYFYAVRILFVKISDKVRNYYYFLLFFALYTNTRAPMYVIMFFFISLINKYVTYNKITIMKELCKRNMRICKFSFALTFNNSLAIILLKIAINQLQRYLRKIIIYYSLRELFRKVTKSQGIV